MKNQGKKPTPMNGHIKGTPYFPKKIYPLLPYQIAKLLLNSEGKGRQQDVLLFSIIHVLSACYPKFFGFYFGKKIFPNLYGILSAPPASGKGDMLTAKLLIDEIHKEYRERHLTELIEYEKELAEWKKLKEGPMPIRPPIKMFCVPGNITTAGLHVVLSNKNIIIIESEIDTMVLISEQAIGDSSDIWRKAFHHERISVFRKTNNEFAEIENPCVAMLLSGTPEQLIRLIKNGKNGVFSRFVYYVFDDADPTFFHPFLDIDKTINLIFQESALYFKKVHFDLLEGGEKEFKFSDSQIKQFLEIFPEAVKDFYEWSGNEGVSIVMRLGIIFFRIAMVLTIVRNQEGDILICDDRDFEATKLIVEVLKAHSLAVYSTLPSEEESSGSLLLTNDVLKMLPDEFKTSQLTTGMSKLGVSRRQIHRIVDQLINEGKLVRVKLGVYRKTNIKN